ncbi:hypothetical protein Tco_0251198 [Tanacetum coccineum]
MTRSLANGKIEFSLELVLFEPSSIMLKRITKVTLRGVDLNDEADEETEELRPMGRDRSKAKKKSASSSRAGSSSFVDLELSIREAEVQQAAQLKREKLEIQRLTLELAERDKRDKDILFYNSEISSSLPPIQQQKLLKMKLEIKLEHYLSMHGFISQAPVSTSSTAADNTATVVMWKEYKYSGAGPFLLKSKRLPCPRLPYPRIDGLHQNTYRTFLESVNFYLGKSNIADLFHIRGIPLYHAHDRSQKWLRMIGDDLVYVYRDGTMQLTDKSDNDKDQNQVMKVVPCKNITDRML